MKNLSIASQQTLELENELLASEKYCCCYNSDKNVFFVLSLQSSNLYVINGSRVEIYFLRTGKPVGMISCSSNEKVYCAFDDGNVMEISYDGSEEISICLNAALLSNGLQCISISPDHDIVVFLTKDFQIVTMSSELEILNENSCISNEFGDKAFVNVGWGKKETQFHGSEGKNAAKTQPAIAHQSSTDKGLPVISWRGDGSLFVVSFLHENARKLKIFNRQGVLQYTSEPVDGLEGTLSWRPSGNLIASSRKSANKYNISLFEKNGLLHREFSLPVDINKAEIRELLWSRESDILVIWYEDMHLELWAEKNYHFYLKQSISYSEENPILSIAWSQSSNNDLLIISPKSVVSYNFRWEVAHSHINSDSDRATVGVIDGDKILLTRFKEVVIPPPMAQQTVKCDEPINAICFAPIGCDPNSLIAVTKSNKISLIDFDPKVEDPSARFGVKKTFDIQWPKKYAVSKHFMHHVLWLKPNVILCSAAGSNSDLCALYFEGSDKIEECRIVARVILECDGQIHHITSSSDFEIAYISTSNSFYCFSNNAVSDLDYSLYDRSEYSSSVAKIQFVKIEQKDVCIALTRKNILYIDGRQVSNNVTSFYVHSDFLLLTTLQHSLLCFKLNEAGFLKLRIKDLTIQPWETKLDNSNSQDLLIRRIERGSILITAVPEESKVILQMPRGNLECIQPRGLSIAIVGCHVDKLNYRLAFDMNRKQRIDLNLLYDHNPQSFSDNVEKFVNDVENPSWLSLFLSELKNEDLTRTTYSASYPESKNSTTQESGNKVEKICCLVRSVMEKKADKYLQPILISLVKSQRRAGLENALRRVKALSNSEEALTYLLYIVNVDMLFDIALGMYDFELVMLVAERSQKDPKEYVPFLNNLKNMEDNYMKFSVDNHLKRYVTALKHLSKIPERFEECLKFMKDHELYVESLKLFPSGSKEYKSIAGIYGKFLLTKNKYQEAGIMFDLSDSLEEALAAFNHALSWQDSIVCLQRLKLSPGRQREIYRDLVDKLKRERRFEEAATILSRHLNMKEDAVALLCEGGKWQQAWHEAQLMQRKDLIESHLIEGVLQHVELFINDMTISKQDFINHYNRLLIVRVELSEREVELKENPMSNNKDIGDFLSDTSSIAGSVTSRSSNFSRASGKTYRSSKNKRKQERKLQSIKEGSMYEDLALLQALHQSITKVYSKRDEVRVLAEMLLRINKIEQGEKLYELMKDFLHEITIRKSTIWDKKCTTDYLELKHNPEESLAPIGRIPSFIDARILLPPEEASVIWILESYKYIFNNKYQET